MTASAAPSICGTCPTARACRRTHPGRSFRRAEEPDSERVPHHCGRTRRNLKRAKAALKLSGAWFVSCPNLQITEERMKLNRVDRTILVQSSNVDLGDVLPQYARTNILRVAGKYFGSLNTELCISPERAPPIAARSTCRW